MVSGWVFGVVTGILVLAVAVLAWLLRRNLHGLSRDGVQAYLQVFDEMEDRGCLVLRRADVLPVWMSKGASGLLGLSIQELTEDIVKLERDFPGRDTPWSFYKNWDGKPTGREFTRQDGKVLTLVLARTKDRKYDLLIFRDGTRDAQAKENMRQEVARLEAAARSQTSFFSRMSHEIRTPMNGITGMLSLAESHLTEDSPAMEYLHRADALADHMLGLLNDILDISRIEANKVELEKKPLSLKVLGDLLLEMYQKTLAAKGVRYTVVYEDVTVDWILGDEMRLRQIIINLLSNAVKFTAQGEIKLTFRQMYLDDKNVDLMIRLHDTGIGMSPEFLDKIFRPFEQESIETSHRYGGTGLGMAITEQLVHLMGGEIMVESVQGQGSDFSVFLSFPLAENQGSVQKQQRPDDSEDAFRGRRILMAEDNEINAMIAREILTEMGAQVDIVPNGQEAVDAFSEKEQGFYDFILMDVQMPVMDGRTAARTIRGLSRQDAKTIPIFALSADAFVEDRRLSVEAGMNDHFAKPVDFAALRKNVSAYLK